MRTSKIASHSNDKIAVQVRPYNPCANDCALVSSFAFSPTFTRLVFNKTMQTFEFKAPRSFDSCLNSDLGWKTSSQGINLGFQDGKTPLVAMLIRGNDNGATTELITVMKGRDLYTTATTDLTTHLRGEICIFPASQLDDDSRSCRPPTSTTAAQVTVDILQGNYSNIRYITSYMFGCTVSAYSQPNCAGGFEVMDTDRKIWPDYEQGPIH